jgi:DNA-binding beta-propeller fold protein YncE
LSGDGGPALQAQLAGPTALAVDGAGNVYVTDAGRRIRKISVDGAITAFAGYGSSGTLTPDGTSAMNAGFAGVLDLAADVAGNVYLIQVTGANQNLVRRIDTNGNLRTVASGPVGIFPAAPQFLAMQGNQVAAYASLTLVMRITSAGATVTAGGGSPQPAPDGTPARKAWFLHPSAMSVNRAGDLYIAEQEVCLIRKVGAGRWPAQAYAESGTRTLSRRTAKSRQTH